MNARVAASTPETAQHILVPSQARVSALDAALRARLERSFDHLAEVAQARTQAGLADLKRLRSVLSASAVSPWVFCLYAKLVTELSSAPRADVTALFSDIRTAASLPAEPGIVAYRDPAVPASWWDHLDILLDTDRSRPFNLKPPSPQARSSGEHNMESGFTLLAADQEFYEEVRTLLRMIILASPAESGSAASFNGASTFFLWGGTVLNAAVNRSAVAAVDLLVHESSHVLLFGLCADGPLTRNSGEERYASPLRTDPRPIDGIFHACFVATRVHLALNRLLDSHAVSAGDKEEAAARRDFNGSAARDALTTLDEHARLAANGERILSEVQDYWLAAEPRPNS